MDRMRQIDASTYQRTHALFAAKRDILPARAVERLAREVVERLAAVRGEGAAVDEAGAESLIDTGLVNSFCDILLADDASAALTFVTTDLASTVADRATVFLYISAAARQLGARWETDEVSFTQVTLAVGKLYALVRSIGSRATRTAIARQPQKSALFASLPGEQHTLGVTIAAEVFRDAGWDIDLQIDRSHEELLARVEQVRPSVVGLSLSNSAGFDALTRLVIALRLAQPDVLIAVAGGPDTTPEKLQTLVDLDLVVTDARQAQDDLMRLLQRRSDT